MGDGEDQLSLFPTAAMDSHTPYAFGVDPVRTTVTDDDVIDYCLVVY